ncbi:hypothetical protein SAMN05192533_101376 [Mesobacillus persicus]|uniref:Uncharacterized protein n=1 Tax=Mesobacillus persicus TaxID=930146 RepID=A0A1H7WFH6_9BACI|nr:hypothetical protein SAMN05192533_101376 [Mesobacillus persicus]
MNCYKNKLFWEKVLSSLLLVNFVLFKPAIAILHLGYINQKSNIYKGAVG